MGPMTVTAYTYPFILLATNYHHIVYCVLRLSPKNHCIWRLLPTVIVYWDIWSKRTITWENVETCWTDLRTYNTCQPCFDFHFPFSHDVTNHPTNHSTLFINESDWSSLLYSWHHKTTSASCSSICYCQCQPLEIIISIVTMILMVANPMSNVTPFGNRLCCFSDKLGVLSAGHWGASIVMMMMVRMGRMSAMMKHTV